MATNYNPGPGYSQTSGFRTASRPNHNGIDYGAEKGTAIPAAVDGEVWRTGYSDTAGYFVILKHVGADGKEFYTTYFHMQGNENLPTNVPKVGTQVKAGDTIGQVGNTGQPPKMKPHLHFEVIDPNSPNGDPTKVPSKGEGVTGTGIGGRINRVSPNIFDNWPSSGVYNWWERANDPSYSPYLKFKSFIKSMLSPIVGALDGIQQIYTSVVNRLFQIQRRDPLMVDINGDGIKTTNVKDGAFFDHDGNGFAEQTGWAASDDGLLVMDRNNDGIINDGKELFGDQTILSNGQRAANGFEALKQLDSNNDNKIDSADTAYSQMKVWQDIDGDGYSTSDELHTLDEVGIKSINLTSTPNTVTDPQGNTQTRTGSFEKTDGTSGTIAEYNLQRDTAYTIANDWLDVPEDIAALPDLQGYGNVYDLQQAIARERQTANGEGLKGLIEQFTTATDINTRNSLMEQILFKWTNSEGIDPASRGTNIDARKLAVLEKFFGQAFVAQNSANPTYEASILLKEAYRGISEMMYSQLMAQTHLKGIYDKINYSWDDESQSVKADMSNVITDIQNLLTADETAGKTVLGEFSRTIRGFGAQDMVKFLFLLMLLTVVSVRNRNLKINLRMEG